MNAQELNRCEVVRAARRLLDAFGSSYPDWIMAEARDLAQALACVESDAMAGAWAQGHYVAAVEHMRHAAEHVVKAGDARLHRRIVDAMTDVERKANARPMGPRAEQNRLEGLAAGYSYAGGPDDGTA